MATFDLTSPDGQKYRVTGPEGSTEQDALRQLQRQLAGLPIEQAPAASNQAADIAKSGGIGLVKGTIGLAGAPSDYGPQSRAAGGFVADQLGISPETQSKIGTGFDWARKTGLLGPIAALGNVTPGSGAIQSTVEKRTGKFYEPKTTAGQYAQTVGEFLPSAALGPGGAPRKVAGAVISGLGSEAAGQAAEAGGLGPTASAAARMAGAALAPAAAERLVTPVRTISPTRQQAVQTLRGEGVTDITGGQATGNKRLRYAESELGGSTAERLQERQQEQFTRAALRRVGTDAERATPEVIDHSFNRIGGRMNGLAARNQAIADAPLIHDLVAARDGYTHLVAQPMQAPVIQHVLDRISNSFRTGGIMPGEVYQTLRSDIGRYARAAKNDPNLQDALYSIQHALDDNVERVMRRNNSNDLGAWRDARRQYRNLLVIERASNYAGEQAASGIISPANLARATKAIQGTRNYARGRGDFTPLARAGVEVLSTLPNSGTAQRLRAHGIPAMIAAALGGTAGSAAGPHGTLGGIAAGLAAPRLAGEAILSGPGRRYLGNQLVPPDTNPVLRGLLRGGYAGAVDDRSPLRITVHPKSREYGGPDR